MSTLGNSRKNIEMTRFLPGKRVRSFLYEKSFGVRRFISRHDTILYNFIVRRLLWQNDRRFW
jgi:hypothetical protein